LGKSPSWNEIKDVMARNPMLFVREWEWDERWNSYHAASSLFIEFTIDIWITLRDDVFKQDRPHPECLQDAMAVWSVRSITDILSHVAFIPSNYNIPGARVCGKPIKGLNEMLSTFFPSQEAVSAYPSKNVWKSLISEGYIQRYHHMLRQHYKDTIDEALEMIFSGLQCLPMSYPATANGCGKLWDTKQGCIKFLTNPIYYRMESIGTTALPRKRTVKVKETGNMIQQRLVEEHEGIPAAEVAKQQRRKNWEERRCAARELAEERRQESRKRKHPVLDLSSESSVLACSQFAVLDLY
jgi:hypothetical protein